MLGMNVSKSSSPAATDPASVLVQKLVARQAPGLVFLDSSRGSGPGRRSWVASDPIETLSETPSGFFAGGKSVDPFDWLKTTSEKFPFVAGMLSFEAAWMLDAIGESVAPTSPRIWAAAYDDVSIFDLPESEVPVSTSPSIATDLRPPDASTYQKGVQSCIKAIFDGEIFEINFTAAFEGRWDATGWELYEAMRAGATGNHFAYMDTGEVQISCVSPEQFLSVHDDVIRTRPIKGTRRRGQTPAEDAQLRQELRTSEKDIAENVMIVDLMRNDLSQVCVRGSVHVPELCGVETFAGVHHLVSTVQGTLDPAVTPLEAFLLCFPAGSITGAPKLRAIELIAELEAGPRGVYTGSIFRSFEGSFDSNVLIRSAEKRGDRIKYGAGGAVVSDSDPIAEWEEAKTKARPFTRLFE